MANFTFFVIVCGVPCWVLTACFSYPNFLPFFFDFMLHKFVNNFATWSQVHSPPCTSYCCNSIKVHYVIRFVIVNMSSLLLGILHIGNEALISVIPIMLNWMNLESRINFRTTEYYDVIEIYTVFWNKQCYVTVLRTRVYKAIALKLVHTS